jgi:Flp pilus assembly protein TadB
MTANVVDVLLAAAAVAFWVVLLLVDHPPVAVFVPLWILMMAGYVVRIVRSRRNGELWSSKDPDDYR